MGKLKTARCAACGEKIGHHDANRVEVRLGQQKMVPLASFRKKDGTEVVRPVDTDKRPILTYHLGCRP